MASDNHDQNGDSSSLGHMPEKGSGTWVFDDQVTAVFDDMLNRSVPCYAHALSVFLRALRLKLHSSAHPHAVLDLGVSTAMYFRAIQAHFPTQTFQFCGVDCSEPMIQKAQENHPAAIYHAATVEDYLASMTEGSQWDVVILSLTLQFMPIEHRQETLQKIYQHLKRGGFLFLFEKCLGADSFEEKLFTDIYYSVKHDMGYSWDAIMEKRKSLENVLVPLTREHNQTILEREGFRVVPVVQWCNFSAYLAYKG